MSVEYPKILSLSTYDISGGAAKAAYRIHSGVRMLGVASTMLVKEKKVNDPTVYTIKDYENKIRLHVLWGNLHQKILNKYYNFRWKKYTRREQYFMSDLRSLHIETILNRFEYDVLHLHWINNCFFPLEVLRFVHRPIVWTLHDSWPFCGVCHYTLGCDNYTRQCGNCPHLHSIDASDLSYKVWKKKQQYYQDLDLHIVAPSAWMAECAQQSTLFRGLPVSVIPNCIDTNVYQRQEREQAAVYLGKDSGKKYILFGAVNAIHDKIKGFAYLCEALKYMAKQYKMDNVELLVFGADKPLQQLELVLPVSYVGFVNEEKKMVSLYGLSDVTVVPSLTENLSCVIMESLACGTPVVAFNVGGNSDMIEHKINGWLADDVYSMAEGIDWFLNNRKKEKFQQEIVDVVQKRFTIGRVAEQYKKLYSSLC